MGESTLIALSMRLTSIAVFLAALAVVLVYLVEANPKARPLTVQANVGINIKSDNTEEAPGSDAHIVNRPEGKRMKANIPITPVKPDPLIVPESLLERKDLILSRSKLLKSERDIDSICSHYDSPNPNRTDCLLHGAPELYTAFSI